MQPFTEPVMGAYVYEAGAAAFTVVSVYRQSSIHGDGYRSTGLYHCDHHLDLTSLGVSTRQVIYREN